MPEIERAAVIGLGPIGASWTVAFARSGLPVSVFDVDAARRDAIADECRRSFTGLGMTAEAILAAMGLVSVATTLADAVAGADYVQEAASETLEVKRALFAALDAACGPETLIVSSTSAMPLTTFAAELPGRERMLIAHPATPPHLLPVVELVPAPFTPERTVARTAALMAAIGQSPIVVRKEVRAFVMNRILAAMFVEMGRLIGDGVVSPRDADAAIRDGFALRWAFLGPLEGADLNNAGGIEEYLTKYNSLYEDYARETKGSAPVFTRELIETIARDMRARVPLENIPERRLWRDESIMALRELRAKRGSGIT
jgi:L-gulonate 3-dehydrogenase